MNALEYHLIERAIHAQDYHIALHQRTIAPTERAWFGWRLESERHRLARAVHQASVAALRGQPLPRWHPLAALLRG